MDKKITETLKEKHLLPCIPVEVYVHNELVIISSARSIELRLPGETTPLEINRFYNYQLN